MLKVGFIGDVVGRAGREILESKLKFLRNKFELDFVVANCENASGGFGLSVTNAQEILSYGVDCITGGNHSFDKKEILSLMSDFAIIRPCNFAKNFGGSGVWITEKNGEKLCVINLMGHYGMPLAENAFLTLKNEINKIENSAILVDFHAEATSEKRALMCYFKGNVSAICGTHTHIGTDDLEIWQNSAYVSDVGLTGCRNGVIGMEADAPIKTLLTGVKHTFSIEKKCKKILQMVIMEFDVLKCLNAYKVRVFDGCDEIFIQKAWVES